MGYFVRRIVGYGVFLSVLGVLTTLVVDANSASGGTALSGNRGAIAGGAILVIALVSSWVVRWSMYRGARLQRYLPR